MLAAVTARVRAARLNVVAEQSVPFPGGGATLVWVLACARRPAGASRHGNRRRMLMRVALYARVSTERQEQQGTIASQLDALTRWAREQHHDVVDAYVCVDDGYRS